MTNPVGQNDVERLYKYRALEPFAYIADIIHKNRFHAAPFFDLNDPMEGLFEMEAGIMDEYSRRLREAKAQLRICSFSRTAKCPVLWAHYAGGFKGICFEVEAVGLGSDFSWDTVESSTIQHTEHGGVSWAVVDYSSSKNMITPELAHLACREPHTLLTKKAADWAIEREVRTFSTEEFVSHDSVKITRILLGLRTPYVMQRVIRQMAPPSVSVWRTRIGERYEIELDSECPL